MRDPESQPISSKPPAAAASPDPPSWWFDRWKAPLAALFAIGTIICGIVTLVSFSPTCWVAGLLQLIAGLIVLAMEAPAMMSCCQCVLPVSQFLDKWPRLLRSALYVLLAIAPCFLACWGAFFVLGFLSSVASALVYAMAFVGPKGARFSSANSPA